MIPSAIAAVILVIMTILVHYEALRLTSSLAPKLHWVPLRARLIVIVCAAFAAHTIEVWIWGLAYFAYVEILRLGSFGGVPAQDLVDFIYFSAVSYTSLGIGDVYPQGGVRLLTGVQALVGLLMIAWSASFTYLSMEKYWPMHRTRTARQRPPEPDQATPPRACRQGSGMGFTLWWIAPRSAGRTAARCPRGRGSRYPGSPR